jgi:hypothetical protein
MLQVQRMKQKLKCMDPIKYQVPFKVCLCLTVNSGVRKRSGQIVRSRPFDVFTLFCMVLVCVVLAIDRPRRSELEQTVTDWIQLSVTIVFWLEMLLKMMWYGPKLYLANAFNKGMTACFSASLYMLLKRH